MDLRSKITEGFENGTFAFRSEGYIADRLHARPHERRAVKKQLESLERDGIIMRDNKGGYATPGQLGVFKATVQGHERGFAFLIPLDRDRYDHDFFVPSRSLAGALNKDVVLAAEVRGGDDEAYVIKILERGTKLVTGVFDCDKRAGYVSPDDIKYANDIYIKPANCMNAKRGDKVVAEIINYVRGKLPEGRITEILGDDGEFFTEELSIIRSHGLYEKFPPAVEREAEESARKPVRLADRRDLRGLYTITIDGADTRDIDDAVSLETESGKFILGVHIADVAEYVKRDGKLDREAYARGTSVYFPDRVLPMLPRALSNGACSLNEGEERYAMSCFMTFDENGNRTACDFCESVIKSDRRMTYSAVNDILKGDESACRKYPDLTERARNMKKLSDILKAKRDAAGAVNLDVREARITISGNVISIPDYERGDAEIIIEQFMVAANEAVASLLEKQKIPCLYRIHERPAPEKASAFLSFVRDLGIKANVDVNETQPSDFSKILDECRHSPAFAVVNKVMLRSMQKARYCEENKGHFGLASECYCHFTSPIRRYPDLFVHRALKAFLRGEIEKARKLYGDTAATTAIDASQKERTADEAERDVDDLYKCEYMAERTGEIYDGIISGVTAFGVFVELKNTVEGLIRLENLPRDEYFFYEEKLLLKGGKHSFRIGEPIRIRVDSCDFGSRRILFAPAE